MPGELNMQFVTERELRIDHHNPNRGGLVIKSNNVLNAQDRQAYNLLLTQTATREHSTTATTTTATATATTTTSTVDIPCQTMLGMSGHARVDL